MALVAPPGGQVTALGDSVWKHRQEHAGLTEVRYAHPDGNNANDGLTWGTAKKDVVSAYDALDSGGTINAAQGTLMDSVITDRGLWVVGPNDPNYGSPPTGWRQQKPFTLVGQPVLWSANGHYGRAGIAGGSGSDRTKPAIWISGTNAPVTFKNIHIAYPAVAVRVGFDASNNFTNTSGIVFEQCGFEMNQAAGNGPGIELGYVFWLWFKDCVLSGNAGAYTLTAATRAGVVATFTTSITHFLEVGDTANVAGVTPSGYNGLWTITAKTATTFTATLTADPGGSGSVFGTAVPVKSYRRAAIAHEADRFGGQSSGLIFFEDTNFNSGGFYYKPSGTTTYGAVVVRNATHEGNFVNHEPPTLFVRTRTYGDLALPDPGVGIRVEGIELADAAPGSAAVEVEGQFTNPSIVSVIGSGAVGNVTMLSNLVDRKQIGLSVGGEHIGTHAGHLRSFSPVAVRYPNLHPSGTLTGGSWTTGLKAPDGTNGAASLTGDIEVGSWSGGGSPAAGVWVIAGVWMKVITLGGPGNAHNIPVFGIGGPGSFDGSAGSANMSFPAGWQDDAWVFVTTGPRLVTTQGDQRSMTLRAGAGSTIAYYAPIVIEIPAADNVSRTEAIEIARHLHTYPASAIAGQIAMFEGQSLHIPSGYIEGIEIADPAAPAANRSRLYTKDNGSGKTQLVVRFPTGAVQVIATEP